MADSATGIKMPAEAYPHPGESTSRLSLIGRPIDAITNSQRTTGARVAVSNTILVTISAAVGFFMVVGTDAAFLLLLYLDRHMSVGSMVVWELFFAAVWVAVSFVMYRILVFVRFAPFRGAKHHERHQC
ncbi:hypothetical protein LX36DRAFT_683446 [Colletotrichum falcatum]|nr:hypothetical protein LX36DRAFT_683446 [Colletotrichum falcatum]